MKIKDIVVESTTAGSIATVEAAGFQDDAPKKPTKSTTKKKYRNSLHENKLMNQMMNDIDDPRCTEEQFKKKYNTTKAQAKKKYLPPDASNKQQDLHLQEDDLIVVPGAGRKSGGFIPHDADRTDHEVEMARSDLKQALKNAENIMSMISSISEEQGLEGWVQEKIIKASDYLNTVSEYLEGKYGEPEGSYGMSCGCSGECDCMEGKTGPGLWANIRARKASGKPMRKKGQKGAPSEEALKSARAGSKK